MGGNPHNPGGRGLGEIARVELEARVLAAERRAEETLVAFRDLSARHREADAGLTLCAQWVSDLGSLLHDLWRNPEEFHPVSPRVGEALTRFAKHPSWIVAAARAAARTVTPSPELPKFVWCIECESQTEGVHAPDCEAVTPSPKPPTWQQAEDLYGFDAMRAQLRDLSPEGGR